MDFGDILKKLAPTAATLIAGPLAGMAVKAIGDAIGMDEPTQEKIERALTNGQLSGDQVVAMRQADDALKVKLAELGIRAEELIVEDRKSAREREVRIGGVTVPALAWIIVMGFLAMAWGILFGNVKAESVIAGTIIGYVSAKCEQVLSYYFGSSRGSDEKNGVISKIANAMGRDGSDR